MNRRTYWTAYHGERLRLDRRNCTRSYECGNTCIALTKECRKDPKAALSKQRLQRIEELTGEIQTARSAKAAELWEKRGSQPRRFGGAAQAAETPSSSKASPRVGEMDPKDIAVDADRFQYKVGGNAQGEVGSLSGVRQWDDNLAGVISVWKDPEDGKTYVVNGHNRLALAKRLGAENVTVRYLKAANAQEARAIGAMQNIAEGHGTSIDAAKFFRDSGITDQQQVEARGLPLRSGRAAEGLALSKLPNHIFNAVVQGDLSVSRGAIIGGSGLDDTKQNELYKLVKSRKAMTDGTLRELVDAARQSEQTTTFELDLFGGSEQVKDNLILRAKITDKLKRKLASEKRLFATVSRSKAAAELEARAGNQINVEESSRVATEAGRVLAVFDQFKNQSGPVSAAINRAVERLEAGEKEATVMRELQREATEAMEAMLGKADRGDSALMEQLELPLILDARERRDAQGINWDRVASETRIMLELNPQDRSR